jgi:hypothetical protein
MADAAPAAADGAAPPAMGNLFDTYTGQGALGGLFAPAYISGFAPSGEGGRGVAGAEPRPDGCRR